MTQMSSKQAEIQAALNVNPNIDVKSEIEKRIAFVGNMLKSSGLTTIVLGISGGVDSLTAGRLCKLAVDRLNEEVGSKKYQFIGVKIPYRVQKDADMVEKSLAFVQPDLILTTNIGDAVDAVQATLQASYETLGKENNEFLVDFTKGNVKARMRMIMQYALAGMTGGLVAGTDHASEAVTGFFTKFGDGGFDFTPLGGLVKCQVRAIAAELGAPAELYNKTPTADLEDNRPGLPDEVALGVSYDDIDTYLLGGKVSDTAKATIEGWYTRTMHKRELPYAPQ